MKKEIKQIKQITKAQVIRKEKTKQVKGGSFIILDEIDGV